MSDDRVFMRTFTGLEALKDHALALTPAQRYVLLQIDGSRDVQTILEATADLGDFRRVFPELEAKGLLTLLALGPGGAGQRAADSGVVHPVGAVPTPTPAAGQRPGTVQASNTRMLDPAASAQDSLRQAAIQAVYKAMGPEADRLVMKLEAAKKNEDLIHQISHCLQVLEGAGRSGEALAKLLEENRLRAKGPVSGGASTLDLSAPADGDLREAANIALYTALGAAADPFVARLAKARRNEDIFMQLALDAEFIEAKGGSATQLRKLLADYHFDMGAGPSQPSAAAPEAPKKSRWGFGKLFGEVSIPSLGLGPASASREQRDVPDARVPSPAPSPSASTPRASSPVRPAGPAPQSLAAVKANISGIVRIGFGEDGEAFLLHLESATTPNDVVIAAERIRSLLQRVGREELAEAVRKELGRLSLS